MVPQRQTKTGDGFPHVGCAEEGANSAEARVALSARSLLRQVSVVECQGRPPSSNMKVEDCCRWALWRFIGTVALSAIDDATTGFWLGRCAL